MGILGKKFIDTANLSEEVRDLYLHARASYPFLFGKDGRDIKAVKNAYPALHTRCSGPVAF